MSAKSIATAVLLICASAAFAHKGVTNAAVMARMNGMSAIKMTQPESPPSWNHLTAIASPGIR